MHIITSVHTEVERMKEEWEVNASKPVVPPKLSRQLSAEPAMTTETTGKSSDTYCYELVSMLIGLCQSESGCSFLSEQQQLMRDLFTLLHVASTRIQLQVLYEAENSEHCKIAISTQTMDHYPSGVLPTPSYPACGGSQEPCPHARYPLPPSPWLLCHCRGC